MLDRDEVTAALSSPMEYSEGEKELQEESGSHADMMCQLFTQMGRLEAKLDMLLDYEMKPEPAPNATDGILSLPSSPQADFYLPMDLATMGA